MRYQLFQYTLPAPPQLEDLNGNLGTQRVASVSHHFVQNAGSAMLVFVVETVPASISKGYGPNGIKVDYRETFGTAEFAAFSKLRDERKKWAEG